MRTCVYVDGFNLYYGALKGTPYKWLDVHQLCCALLPRHQIEKIKYFTAHLSARKSDPGQPIRQQTYLRALSSLPNVEIILGHFLTHVVSMPLAGSPADKPQYANVLKTEEKGSDVNIATHLLHDAYQGRFEAAVLISNDSDLQEPVRIVCQELGFPVGILNPYRQASRVLARHATFVKTIRKGALATSQFPATLHDPHGAFTKPGGW